MAYTPTVWADGAEGETPITAARLNKMEQGIKEGQNTAAPKWDTLAGKPATFPPTVGTKATDAAAGDHKHVMGDVTGLDAALKLKATVAALTALEARVATLETA